jgi:hypothetical protein
MYIKGLIGSPFVISTDEKGGLVDLHLGTSQACEYGIPDVVSFGNWHGDCFDMIHFILDKRTVYVRRKPFYYLCIRI